jgi:hypothetical protein
MYSDSLQTNPQTGSVGASRVVRVAILSGLFVCSLLGFGTETACGATFRVDDSSLTVPAILSDDWQTVKLRKTWARADGKKIGDEPQFSRFLARDYRFTVSGPAFRIKTTWFAAGKCVSTDELVSSLINSKRIAIESVVGSLDEMNRRLQANPGVSENRVIVWAHLKSKRDVTVPVDALAAEDAAILAPFVELAKQSFDTRLSRSTKCKESEDPKESREAARSGGRRMRPSKSQSGTRSSSTRATPPRPTGGLVVGALPEAGTAPVRPDRRVDDKSANKQKWSILISQFVAKAGSLVFEPAVSFTRCVTARSEAEAITRMRATYPPVVSSGNGKRTSYRITGGAGGCERSGSDASSSEPSDTGSPDSDGASDGGPSSVGPGGADSFTPYPDPLDVEPAFYADEAMDDFGNFDLEAIPTSDDFGGELVGEEADSAQPSIDSTEPAES